MAQRFNLVDFQGAARNAVFVLYQQLELKTLGDAMAIVVNNDRDAEKTLAAVIGWSSAADVSPKLVTAKGAVLKKLRENRGPIKCALYELKHEAWLTKHNIGAKARDIRAMEWEVAPTNPFILLRHGVSYGACLAFPAAAPLTDITKRYGAALDLLGETRHASMTEMSAHLRRSGLVWNDDVVNFDPSCGLKPSHELYDEDVERDGVAESFADVSKRVDTVSFFDYAEFRHLDNALSLQDGGKTVWLGETHDARTFLHAFLGRLARQPEIVEPVEVPEAKRPRIDAETFGYVPEADEADAVTEAASETTETAG